MTEPLVVLTADQLRELVRSAVAEALAEVGAGPGLIRIEDAGVPRRSLLAAERRREITVHRRGRQSWVDRLELERWIRAAPAAPPEPADEITEILAAQGERRRR